MTKEKATITSKKITKEERFFNRLATFFFQVEYAKRNAYKYDKKRYMDTKALYKSVLSDLNKKGINVDRIIQPILNHLSDDNILNLETYTIPSNLLPCNSNIEPQSITLGLEEMQLLRSLKKEFVYFFNKYLLFETDIFSETNLAQVIHNFSFLSQKKRMDQAGTLFHLPNTIFHHERKEYISTPDNIENTIKIEIDITNYFSYKEFHRQINELLLKYVPLVVLPNEIVTDTTEKLYKIKNIDFVRKLNRIFDSPTTNRMNSNAIVPRLIGLWLWDRENKNDYYNPKELVEKELSKEQHIFQQFDLWKNLKWDDYLTYLNKSSATTPSKAENQLVVAGFSRLSKYTDYNNALEITKKSIEHYEKEKLILV